MSYRKREIGHWNQGKGYKGTRKAKEREYTAQEIKQQIDEQYPEFRYHMNKRNPNRIAQAEYSIAWYTQVMNNHSDSWRSYCKSGLERAQKKLEKLQQEKTKTKCIKVK